MKNYLLIAFAAVSATVVAQTTVVTPVAPVVDAATTTTTTTTTIGTGTVTEYVPGSTMIVKESAGPVTYSYGETVTYVTSTGETIPMETAKTMIKVGAPVSVSYATQGYTRVIERVELGEMDDAEIEVEDGKIEVESD